MPAARSTPGACRWACPSGTASRTAESLRAWRVSVAEGERGLHVPAPAWANVYAQHRGLLLRSLAQLCEQLLASRTASGRIGKVEPALDTRREPCAYVLRALGR